MPRKRQQAQDWFSLLTRGLSYLKDKAFYSAIYAAVRSAFAGFNPSVFIGFFITMVVSSVASDAIIHIVPINEIVSSIYGPIAEFLEGILPASRILDVLHVMIPGIMGALIAGITIGLPLHYLLGNGIAAGLYAIPGYCLRATAAQLAKSAIRQTNYLSEENAEIVGNALGHALADTLMDYPWPTPSSPPPEPSKPSPSEPSPSANNLKQSADVPEGNVYAFFKQPKPARVAPRLEGNKVTFRFEPS